MDPLENVARELGLLIRSLKGMHSAVTASTGSRVEMPALALLARLDDHGRQRPSALAEALHVDLSSVSRQVAALEREGWVARERDPDDSRAALLELTDRGRRVLDEVRAARVAHLRSRLPGWTAEELEAFAAQLHRFRTDVAADDAPSGPGTTGTNSPGTTSTNSPGTTSTNSPGTTSATSPSTTRTTGTTSPAPAPARTPAYAGQEDR